MPAARSRVTQTQYELLARFRYSLRQFLSFSEQAARAAGITPQQHQALLAIKGFAGGEGITIGALAEFLKIRHHSAVGLVDRLSVEGYARRVPAKDDRRRVRLALSPRGEAILEKLTYAHRAQLHGLGPEINRLLERIRGEDASPAE
jgi:DNA-binding MarR family transcriptional regulator